ECGLELVGPHPHELVAQTLLAVAQHVGEVQCDAVAGGGDDGGVEVVVGGHERGDRLGGQRVGGDRPLLAAQGVLDRGGGVGGPAVGDGPAGGGGLDGFARLEDVGGLVRRHRAHQRALAGGEGEQ